MTETALRADVVRSVMAAVIALNVQAFALPHAFVAPGRTLIAFTASSYNELFNLRLRYDS